MTRSEEEFEKLARKMAFEISMLLRDHQVPIIDGINILGSLYLATLCHLSDEFSEMEKGLDLLRMQAEEVWKAREELDKC